MGAAAIPLMFMSTGLSMVGQRKAASAESRAVENDSKRAAEAAKSQANEETIASKERLLQALSSQMAGAGASGAGLAGSSYNVMQTDINEAQKEQYRRDLGTRIGVSNIKQSGKAQSSLARKRGNLAMATSLVQLGSGVAGASGTGVKPNVPTGGGGKPVGALYSGDWKP